MTLQDSVPSHRAKVIQQFLRQNTPDFIAADESASYCSDLNPLDYCILDILQDLMYACRRLQFATLQDQKEAIKNNWKEVTIETVRKSIAQWKNDAVRKQNGGTFSANRCDWISISCSETCWNYWLFCTLRTPNAIFSYFTVKTKGYNVMHKFSLLFNCGCFLFEFYCGAVQHHCKVWDVFHEPPGIIMKKMAQQ